MRTLLLNYGLYIVWFLAITEFMLMIAAIKGAKDTLNKLCAAVCFGLAVDAAIMAAGILIGEGIFLKSISQIRYLLHGILIPLLIPIAFYVYGVRSLVVKRLLWSVTGLIIIAGIAMGIMTKTEPILLAGVLRYAQSDLTPAFASTVNVILSFGGVLPLIIVGLAHLIRHRSPWLLISGAVMFAFSALAPATGNMDINFLTTMIGEDFMVFFFGLELSRVKKEAFL